MRGEMQIFAPVKFSHKLETDLHNHNVGNRWNTLSNAEFLALKHESRIFGHSSNSVSAFSMMEQVRLCAVWKLAYLLLEPDTGLDHCPRILLSCLRARTSGQTKRE